MSGSQLSDGAGLTWTSNTPRVPGWYWRKPTSTAEPYLVQLIRKGRSLYYAEVNVKCYLKGEWAGPIQEPK